MHTTTDVAARQVKLVNITEAIREAAQTRCAQLFKTSVSAERSQLDSIMPSNRVALAHVLWVCDEIQKFIGDQRFEKANRWIGFAQGVLWITGAASINESREVNAASLNESQEINQ